MLSSRTVLVSKRVEDKKSWSGCWRQSLIDSTARSDHVPCLSYTGLRLVQWKIVTICDLPISTYRKLGVERRCALARYNTIVSEHLRPQLDYTHSTNWKTTPWTTCKKLIQVSCLYSLDTAVFRLRRQWRVLYTSDNKLKYTLYSK